METVFWVLGWFFCIITMIVNGFVIFLVCSQRQLRTKTNTFVVLKWWLIFSKLSYLLKRSNVDITSVSNN